MNIGIDIDGTITEMPQFYAVLTAAMKQFGHKIYIVSYRGSWGDAETINELTSWNITYDKLCTCSDNVTAAVFKRKMAETLSLDLMIDDEPEVINALPPKCKRFWVCDREIYDIGRVIPFLVK